MAGRPRGSTSKRINTTKKEEVVNENGQLCGACNKKLNKNNAYKSYNPIHVSGLLPYCKNCIKKLSTNKDGTVNVTAFKKVLRTLDRPFIQSIFDSSLNDEKETIGIYMKNIGMYQYRDLTWDNSTVENTTAKIEDARLSVNLSRNSFVVTDEIIDKWGYGYTPEMYEAFERKYRKLVDNYTEKTALHTENLLTYIRFRVQEEFCTAKGDSTSAKNWASMAKEAAQSAKLNVSQLTASDLSGGIDTISQLFESVEEYASLIPILPKLLEQPYDDADVIIWALINYQRRLNDLPRVKYRDIYNFYDEMMEEIFKAKGYTDEQIEEEKKKRNNVFRDLGEVYKEPLYESDDFVGGEDVE